MSRKDFDNAEAELQALERELVALLRANMTAMTEGKNTHFFFNDEYNAHSFPAHYLSDASREALQIAQKTIELRTLLILPTEQCIGRLFIDACKESSDFDNPHRLGPKRLAERLLSQLDDLHN